MAVATGDLMARARAGDGEAFRELTEPYRRELQVHCYRMLGSFQDAEDVLQDTLLTAWQSLRGFEGRSSLRTWLYRIATTRCLNALRSARRRPAAQWEVVDGVPSEPSRLGEVAWLEPFPDALLSDAADVPLGPEARYEQTEAVSLAFVTALQLLPPRQVAVLILRDVLGYRAGEVADLLDTSVESVNSALKRARTGVQRRRTPAGAQEPAPAPAAGSAAEQAVVARFARAYAASDIDGLLAVLTDDIHLSMPPMPHEYLGLAAVARFYAGVIRPGAAYDVLATRANAQPALASYRHTPDGTRCGTGLLVLTLSGDRIRSITRFDATVLPSFGLPPSFPA